MSQYGQSAYPAAGTEPTQVAGGYPGASTYSSQPYGGQSFGPQPGYPYGGGPGQPGSPYGQPGGQPGRNRTKIIIAAIVAVLVIAGGAVGLVLGLSGGDKKSEVQTQPKPPVASSTVPDTTDKTSTDKTSTDQTPSDKTPSDNTTSGDTKTDDTTAGDSSSTDSSSTDSSDDTSSDSSPYPDNSDDTASDDSTDTNTTTTASDLEACQAAIPAIQSITDGASSTQLATAATKVNRAADLAENPDLRSNLQAIAGTYQDAADGNSPDTSKLYEEGFQVGQICRAAGYSG